MVRRSKAMTDADKVDSETQMRAIELFRATIVGRGRTSIYASDYLSHTDFLLLQLTKRDEALEEIIDLAKEVDGKADNHNPAHLNYLILMIIEIARMTCKALGREWGYWRENEASDGKV